MVAPIAPALVALQPSRRRRVTLPLYQNSLDQLLDLSFSDMTDPSHGALRRTTDHRQNRRRKNVCALFRLASDRSRSTTRPGSSQPAGASLIKAATFA